MWRFTGPTYFELWGQGLTVVFSLAGTYQLAASLVTGAGEIPLGTHHVVVSGPTSPTAPSVVAQVPSASLAQPAPAGTVEPLPTPPVTPVAAGVTPPLAAYPSPSPAQGSAAPAAPPAVEAPPTTLGQWLAPQLLSPTPFAHIGAGDLNGDGYADLVAAHVDSKQLSLFKGNGDGTFVPMGELALDLNPDRILVADFAGSALADVVAVNWVMRRAVLLVSGGPSSLGTPTVIGFPAGARDVWVGQLNDHPTNELVWITVGGPVVWSFARTGQVIEWKSAPESVLAVVSPVLPYTWADLTGDGKPEFAYYSQNPGEIILVQGDSLVELAVTPGRVPLVQLVAADVDGDGRVDLIGLDPMGRVHTLRLRMR